LCLLHHANAVEAAVDPQRPLSDAGRRHAERIAERAQARELRPDVIWHSGKLRARQTAEPLWRRCNPLAEFSAARALQPDDPPEWIRDTVDGDPRLIVLVGHMPHMARLYRLLTEAAPSGMEFPLHGLVALSREDSGWVEVWREI
jgi:phosphohistidine phosphatase